MPRRKREVKVYDIIRDLLLQLTDARRYMRSTIINIEVAENRR